MAGREQEVDDSFLDDLPDDSFLDDVDPALNSGEGTPTQGVVGPSGDVGERAPDTTPKDRTSVLGAIDRGGFASVPGVKQLGAAANTALDIAQHPGGNIADTYDAWMRQKRQSQAQAVQDRPITSGVSSLLANLGVGAMVGPAIEGSKMVGAGAEAVAPFLQRVVGPSAQADTVARQGLTTLGFAGSSAADEGRIQDTGKIALEGALIGEGLNLAKRGIVKAAGKVMSGAQNAADDFSTWVAKSKIGRVIAGDTVDEPSGAFTSGRVRDLQKTIAAGDPDFGATTAKMMSDAEASLGTSGTARLDQLSDAEKQAVAQHFADLIKERGAKGVTPTKVMENWEAIVNRYVGGEDKGTAMDLLRGVNKRDAKWLASAGAGIEDTNHVLGISDEVLPEVKDMFAGAQRSRTAAAEDRMNRFGQAKTPSEVAGTYQVDVSKLPASEQEAYNLGKLAREGHARIEGPEDFSAPTKALDVASIHERGAQEAADRFYGKNYPKGGSDNIGDALTERIITSKTGEEAADKLGTYQAFAKRTGQNTEAELGNKLERARFWRDHLAALDEAKVQAAGNAQELSRLDREAQKAKAALHAIGVGRGAIENAAGGIAAMAGGTRGILTAAVGAALGKPLARGVFKGIDLVGATGQKLAQVASVAERLATMDNEVGRAARWALSANGDQAIARMAVLAKLKEVQQEIEQ